MAGSLNKVILIGNLGKDPELKTTPSGMAVAHFSLATTENWKSAAGEKQSKTEWHNIDVWGKQAEVAAKYLTKGKQVMIEGRIQYREYTDQAGVKKMATSIRCDNFVMLGSMGEGGATSKPAAQKPAAQDDYEAPPVMGGNYDDDIPY